MSVHGNLHCQHTDPMVVEIRRLQDNGDAHALLQAVQRLQSAALVLSDYQNTVLEVQELGALVAMGVIEMSEFERRTDLLATANMSVGGSHLLADMKLWRVRLAIGLGQLDFARKLTASFYGTHEVTPLVEVHGDMASVCLYEADGELETAMELCCECLARVDKAQLPCVYECISLDLARMLVKDGRPAVARSVLHEAGIPVSLADKEMAKFG
jgi:hypothetical protein